MTENTSTIMIVNTVTLTNSNKRDEQLKKQQPKITSKNLFTVPSCIDKNSQLKHSLKHTSSCCPKLMTSLQQQRIHPWHQCSLIGLSRVNIRRIPGPKIPQKMAANAPTW